MDEPLRIVRMLFPATLLREVDETVISGVGGFQDRTDLVVEAVKNYLLELKYESAPESEATAKQTTTTSAVLPPGQAASAPVGPRRATDLAIHVPKKGVALRKGIAKVEPAPLFGLHNFDFASIWVASELAHAATSESIPMEPFIEQVVASAWGYGTRLTQSPDPNIWSHLFPTNDKKPQSAEGRFRQFAIGRVTESEGRVEADGALFQWQICQVEKDKGGLRIGLTEPGWTLLHKLEGLAPTVPHSAEHAEAFLAHLRRFAPEDWQGFSRILTLIQRSVDRTQLLEKFGQNYGGWTAAQVSTNTSGYVARGREWGLIDPKLRESRYHLTDFGRIQFKNWGESIETN